MNVAATIDKLQKRCIYLQGKNVSFLIHSWGAHPNHPDNPLHKHSFFEICYVFDGTGLYFEDGQSYPLQKGVFFCSRPEKLHRIHKGKNLSLFWVGFEVDLSSSTEKGVHLFKCLSQMKTMPIQRAEDSLSSHLLTTLMKHGSLSCPTEILNSLSHSFLLSLQVLFCGADEKEDESNINNENKGRMLVNQAQLFIRDNLNRPLSITDVAQYLHISTRHLSRLFTHHLGVSYTAFIRQERIDAAAEMLRMTNLDIKTISEQYCFSSVHYFTRVFQEEMGLTPGKYRKQASL
ncbi:AraC family transcriptional regulator [Domibacillus robiginosus]|uniref:AraC family transcriptional regulator n=1 Tax=Domibacillus robiginosus TaxID=1071054 RepID=UPI00067E07CE|nr:AraC family transcriptional regulator [Domibacillus robiginosus]